MTNNSSTSPPELGQTKQAMVIWSDPRLGLGSSGRSIAHQLEQPHGYQLLEIDLPQVLSPGPWIHSIASVMGHRVERSMLASLGWQAVKDRIIPDQLRVAVAMDPVAAAVVDNWRGKGLINVPLVGVVSSLYLDPAWAYSAVDRLSVADPIQAEVAFKLGLPLDCLVPSGIPVCSGFSSVCADDKDVLRQKFGLPLDRAVVLVVTHGMDQSELSSTLFQLSLVADGAKVLFDVARDEDAAQLLRRRAGIYNFQAQLFGKVEDAGLLWAASDIVLAKPHIYIEQRALALRLPYIFLLPHGELEQAVARVYGERGIGRVVHQVSTLAADVELQLDPETLAASRQAIGEISRRKAVIEIARLVAQVGANGPRIMAETREQLRQHEAAKVDETSRTQTGPLETIGSLQEVPLSNAVTETETLADLMAAEEDLNRRISEHHAEVERWTNRTTLARKKNQMDLLAAAEKQTEQHRAAMHTALAELARLAQRKAELPRPTDPADEVELSFREMEVEEALAALKRKL